ncbi:alpha/beta hydrolase [Umezawaea sp. Da 62-37]|uniref:alpha/beta fold hydrolase n=1 Tax=Umezawaea sp. Da 62-37 TaxID=3075927 RepID=UPI0028F71859|nr:alpha/beta hydrolase [Umezawaea sp. Da 62-37]WNV92043.1 alpha/beta hydrolase [Umezawaea sp. Da 62-37]
MRPMVDLVGQTAVLLPGTASDEVFVRSVFEEPLAQVGMRLTAPATVSVDEHVAALDAAWTGTPLVIGGISLGAHVAAGWAVRHPERCAALLVALPAWHGPAGDAPAALVARASAAVVEREGVDQALAGVDGWLGAELDRAWRRHGPRLAETLRAAAESTAPEPDALARLRVPAGVAACSDDPIHPLGVARSWTAALPGAVLRTTTLAALGADRAALGRTAVLALLHALT